MTNWPEYYVTEVWVEKDKKWARYKTKSLTQYHARLRVSYPKSRTMKCDTTVDWPFGVWSEVIAEGDFYVQKRAEKAARMLATN